MNAGDFQEIVEILDDKGGRTGKTCSRDEVHIKEQWHSVVHIWIINSKREILLQKRSKNKSQYANVWHISAAGHMTASESPQIAAIKEIKEELGLEANTRDLIEIGTRNVSQMIPEIGLVDKERVHIFLLKRDFNPEELLLQEQEVRKAKFYSLYSFRKDILDPVKAKKYLNHPKSYYLETIEKIRKFL